MPVINHCRMRANTNHVCVDSFPGHSKPLELCERFFFHCSILAKAIGFHNLVNIGSGFILILNDLLNRIICFCIEQNMFEHFYH